MIEKLTPEHQAAAVAAYGAVEGLAKNGEANRAVSIIEKLAPEQQTAVLTKEAATALRNAGQYANVERLLKAQPGPGQRQLR